MEQENINRFIPVTSIDSGKLRAVTSDVAYYTNQIVNLIMIGEPGGSWVLVDTGMHSSAEKIIEKAEERFGINNPPSAIILTHGHFDHVGNVVDLVLKWKCPIAGHGTAMQGKELKEGLLKLILDWKEIALPSHGKWVNEDIRKD